MSDSDVGRMPLAGELNTPSMWVGTLSTAIALAIREYGDGNPHRAQALLRSTLEDYLSQSDCSAERFEHLTTTARLPRVGGGA